MDFKETIEYLQALAMMNPNVKSTGWGEIHRLATDKDGFKYSRCYITPIEASQSTLEITLYLVDAITPDLKDKLSKASSTLTTIKEVVQRYIAESLVRYDDDITYEPLNNFSEDLLIGWKSTLVVALDENVNICK